MSESDSGKVRPKLKKATLIRALTVIANVCLSILINIFSAPTIIGPYIVHIVVIFIVILSVIPVLRYDILPSKMQLNTLSSKSGIWLRLYSKEIRFVIGTFFGTCVLLAMVIPGFLEFIDVSQNVSVGSEKDLAQNYCRALEKQDYHRIYYYYKDGTTGITIAHQHLEDETSFVSLAQSANKRGRVSACQYQSSKKQGQPYHCEMVNAGEGSGEACYEQYSMTLLIRRGGTSYATLMLVTLTTGSYGDYGHINEIERL